MEDIKRKLTTRELSLPDALAKALPMLRGRITDDKLMWLVHELQGYPDALDYFKGPDSRFPPYRVVKGALRMLAPDGNLLELKHPWANRDTFFLSAPISWLEDSINYPEEPTMVDMAELTSYLGRGQGNVVLLCSKDSIRNVLNAFKRNFMTLLDNVGASSPQ